MDIDDPDFWQNSGDLFGVDWSRFGASTMPLWRVTFLSKQGREVGEMIIPALDEREAKVDADGFNRSFHLFPRAEQNRTRTVKYERRGA